ncbi:MAG: hypothetical protein GY930_07695 [bacterium]|nr:hypothetical protein [bacterium]
MPDSKIKPHARRKRRLLLKAFLLGSVGVGLVAFLPNHILNPLVRRLAPKAANWAGWDLQLSGLSGAPWGTWRLEGLTLAPSDGQGPLQSFQLDELHLQAKPKFWLSPQLENIEEIWGRGGSAQVLISESDAAPEETNATPILDLGPLPRLDLADFQVHIQRPGVDQLQIQGLRLGLKKNPNNESGSILAIRIDDGQHLPETGPPRTFGLDGSLHLTGNDLEVREFQLTQQGGGEARLLANLDLTSLTRPVGDFSVAITDWPTAELGLLNVRARGELEAQGVRLEELDGHAGQSTVLRLETVSVPWPADDVDILSNIEANVVVGGSDLDIWLKFIAGEEDPSGKDWPLGSYSLEAQISSGLVHVQQARVTLEHGDWPAPLLLSTKGDLAVDPGRDVETNLSGLISIGKGKWIDSNSTTMEWPSITGNFAFEGTWPTGKGHLELHRSDVHLTLQDQTQVQTNWSGRCDLHDGALELRSLVGQFGTDGTNLPGELRVRGKLPNIEALQNDHREAPLQLQVNLAMERLTPLRSLLPGLRRIEGRARGQVSVSGTLGTPKLQGSIDATADSVRFATGESISHVIAQVAWADSSEGTFELKSEYGGAPIDVQGTVILDQGQANWNATVNAQNFPILRTPDARLRADGDLRVQGRGAKFDVEGDVHFTHGRLQRDFDLTGSLLAAVDGRGNTGDRTPDPGNPEELLEVSFPPDCSLNVNLSTRKPVDLISDLGRSSLEIEGRLIGRAGRLYPEGTVVLNGGRISLPGSTLTWKQGVVLLPKGGGVPTIEAQGNTRLSGHDVTLRVHGPLNAPLLDLNSTPQKPDYDLLILLLTGELPQGRDWTRTTESLSLYLAKDVLRRWLGSEASDGESVLDRLEFTTGREVSDSGLGTLEAMFRLKGDVSGRGKALWITAERDRYEDINFGLRFILRPR